MMNIMNIDIMNGDMNICQPQETAALSGKVYPTSS